MRSAWRAGLPASLARPGRRRRRAPARRRRHLTARPRRCASPGASLPRRRQRRAFPLAAVARERGCTVPRAVRSSPRAPRGTAVEPTARFAGKTDRQVVEGRFSADGRRPGNQPLPRPGAQRLRLEDHHVLLRLIRRAAPDRTCEPLHKGRLWCRSTSGTGCTRRPASWTPGGWIGLRDDFGSSCGLPRGRRRSTPVSGGTLKGLAAWPVPRGVRQRARDPQECGRIAFSLAADGDQPELRRRADGGQGWQRRPCGRAAPSGPGAAGGPGRYDRSGAAGPAPRRRDQLEHRPGGSDGL